MVYWKVKVIYRPDRAKWGPEMLEKRAKVGLLRVRRTSASGDLSARLLDQQGNDLLPTLDRPSISGAEDHGLMLRDSERIENLGQWTVMQQAWWCEPAAVSASSGFPIPRTGGWAHTRAWIGK